MFRLFSLTIISLFLLGDMAYALPDGGNVVSGASTMTQPNAATLQINQTTDRSIINWQGYNIGANEQVFYFQPSANSISLNRVVGVDPSHIYGSLSDQPSISMTTTFRTNIINLIRLRPCHPSSIRGRSTRAMAGFMWCSSLLLLPMTGRLGRI